MTKEKRIWIVEADKSDLDNIIFSVAWEHLDKVKGNEISRAEAVKRMAKALCQLSKKTEDCNLCSICWEEGCNLCDFDAFAEAALNALLGKEEARNGDN